MKLLPPILPDEQYPIYDYSIDLGESRYRIVLTFRERLDSWYLDLYDAAGTLLLVGKRLSVNNPLLDRYAIDGLPPGELVCVDTSGNDGLECGYADLGHRCALVYLDPADIPEASAAYYEVTVA